VLLYAHSTGSLYREVEPYEINAQGVVAMMFPDTGMGIAWGYVVARKFLGGVFLKVVGGTDPVIRASHFYSGKSLESLRAALQAAGKNKSQKKLFSGGHFIYYGTSLLVGMQEGPGNVIRVRISSANTEKLIRLIG
jgi:hypothetical protein